jgi:hypothetical protein
MKPGKDSLGQDLELILEIVAILLSHVNISYKMP